VALQLLKLCLSTDQPEILAEIVQLVQSATPEAWADDVFPVPINRWWEVGEVQCSNKGWEATAAMLPWLLDKVCCPINL
jgi:hypothetical protein